MSTTVAHDQRVICLSDLQAPNNRHLRQSIDAIPAVSFASHWGAVKCLLLTHGLGKSVVVDSAVLHLMRHELSNVLAKTPGTKVQLIQSEAPQLLIPWRTKFALIAGDRAANFHNSDYTSEVTLALITENPNFDAKRELHMGAKFVVINNSIFALDADYLKPIVQMKILGGYSGPRD